MAARIELETPCSPVFPVILERRPKRIDEAAREQDLKSLRPMNLRWLLGECAAVLPPCTVYPLIKLKGAQGAAVLAPRAT
jgi:hypothetical protein